VNLLTFKYKSVFCSRENIQLLEQKVQKGKGAFGCMYFYRKKGEQLKKVSLFFPETGNLKIRRGTAIGEENARCFCMQSKEDKMHQNETIVTIRE